MPNRDIPEGTPTQVAHPWRAGVRTVVQNILPWGAALWGLIALMPSLSAAVAAQEGVPPEIIAGLSAVGGFCAVLTGVIARIMATPGVEAWLAKHAGWLATGVHTEYDTVKPGIIEPEAKPEAN